MGRIVANESLQLADKSASLVEGNGGPWRHGCSIDGQQALGDPRARVAVIVARHGELLTRVARSFSLCADDAQDAVQRSLEIYLRRVESLDPATELAWLKVVVKHEALAVRRGRAGVAARGGRPRRGPGGRPALGRGAARVGGAGRAVGGGHAAAQARRGAGADAQGRGAVLRRDRRAARVDVHEGQSLHHRGPAPVHEASTRSSRREPSASASRRAGRAGGR